MSGSFASCCYQKDERAKFVTALESSALSEVEDLSIEKYFHVVF
jgi:hypothetical protein